MLFELPVACVVLVGVAWVSPATCTLLLVDDLVDVLSSVCSFGVVARSSDTSDSVGEAVASVFSPVRGLSSCLVDFSVSTIGVVLTAVSFVWRCLSVFIVVPSFSLEDAVLCVSFLVSSGPSSFLVDPSLSRNGVVLSLCSLFSVHVKSSFSMDVVVLSLSSLVPSNLSSIFVKPSLSSDDVVCFSSFV